MLTLTEVVPTPPAVTFTNGVLRLRGVEVGPIFGSSQGRIAPHHMEMLAASGIPAEHAEARGYETITGSHRLTEMGIVRAARDCVPGLLIPMLRLDGSTWGYQYRADDPRFRKDGRPVKYETPWQQLNGLDVPPGVGDYLGDPTIPLWITEGVKKADCGAQYGLCIVALTGVWSWRGTNDKGGRTVIADFNEIALNNGRRVILAFDGDVSRNPKAAQGLCSLAEFLKRRGASVEYLHLPDTVPKTGLDDYLVDGHTAEDLWTLVKPNPPPIPNHDDDDDVYEPEPEPERQPVQPISLEQAHKVFRKWLGEHYDTDALNAMLATVAVERFEDDSDLIWLLLVSGSGNAKTETVQACDGAGAIVTSSLSSDAALLSGTPKHERAKGATGGLLRKIGNRGVLVIKDVTSILSMDRNMRAKVLAALREVYDGRWTREVGSGGGNTLSWRGRIAVIGAVTTAWDTHHSVIAMMGDRFVLLRTDSAAHRLEAGGQAIANIGFETAMRAELAEAVAGVIAGMDTEPIAPSPAETKVLLAAANLATRTRTAVEHDYRGDVVDAHAPEAPTRFAKQLGQLVRGGIAIGMSRHAAVALALRCARDSVPPLRLALLNYLTVHPSVSTTEARRDLDKPRATVDRGLQALHALGLVTISEVSGTTKEGKETHFWRYSLADGVDPSVLVPKKARSRRVIAGPNS